MSEKKIDFKKNIDRLDEIVSLISNKTLSLEANRRLRGETTNPTFEFDVSLDRQDLLGFKEKLICLFRFQRLLWYVLHGVNDGVSRIL